MANNYNIFFHYKILIKNSLHSIIYHLLLILQYNNKP